MSKVAVWAKIPAAPGKRDDLAAALGNALETAKSEAGTVYYILHNDPNESQDALNLHMGSEAFKALGPAITPFLGGRPELHFVEPIGGKGA